GHTAGCRNRPHCATGRTGYASAACIDTGTERGRTTPRERIDSGGRVRGGTNDQRVLCSRCHCWRTAEGAGVEHGSTAGEACNGCRCQVGARGQTSASGTQRKRQIGGCTAASATEKIDICPGELAGD